MTEDLDHHATKHALEASSQEFAEIDSLLIKLATSGLGLSVTLGAIQPSQRTCWLIASWFSLLCSVFFVLVSKYVAAAALRGFYESRRRRGTSAGHPAADRAQRLEKWVKWANWTGGTLFLTGALLLTIHVLTID